MKEEVKVISFEEAIEHSAKFSIRSLLLGNGFSIACFPNIFSYGTLFSNADFSKMPEVKEVFKNLNTQDFEVVINALENCRIVMPAYVNNTRHAERKLKEHSRKLKEVLIETIAKNHPELPSKIDAERYDSCIKFLNLFIGKSGSIYTLNYDLLLYWTLMHGKESGKITASVNDGFGKDIDYSNGEFTISDYVLWQGENAHQQNIHYLHGALHVYENGPEIEKFTWVNTGRPLIEQITEALEKDRFPLFVAEGDSNQKLTKIKHSAYLHHSYKSFSKKMETKNKACLFTYGFSFSDNDLHIINKIAKGAINQIYVGLFGSPQSESTISIMKAVNEIKKRRSNNKIDVIYYDSESANVWD